MQRRRQLKLSSFGCMNHNSHYSNNGMLIDISKTVRNRMSTYVNFAKAMLSRGCTSNGRTFNVTFATFHGKVLSIGWNDFSRHIRYVKQFKTNVKHYGEPSYNLSLHGEISCLLKLGYEDCSDIDFFSIRIDRNGHCCNSQPCKNCERILRMVGFKHVYYFDNDMNMCSLVS